MTRKRNKAKAKAKSKTAAKKVVKLKSKKPGRAAASNGLPRPSTKSWGAAGKALLRFLRRATGGARLRWS